MLRKRKLGAIEALEAALKTSDLEDIEAKTQKLTEVSLLHSPGNVAKQAEGGAADVDAESAASGQRRCG